MNEVTTALVAGLVIGTLCGFGIGFIVGRAFERWVMRCEKDNGA